MTIRNITAVAAGMLLSASTVFAQAGMPNPNVFEEVGIDQKLDEQIPLDLTFRNERGETVRLGEYFGRKPVIVSLVYYNCPMLCTQILNGMVETFRIINFTAGNEFEVVTVSIDPTETDSLASAKKAEYITAYDREGTAGGWHFLTGDQEQITRLAQSVGFRYVYDESNGQYAHASGIMVATPDGRLAR
ncbi:MAG: SCO family protein, partial [Ignavibacteria bacterium]|nr:SCO family protein [Ignavibacteria bacterium]